ncbi:MAG: hypothetical protein ACRDB1_15100 [Microcoleaceae cyanobacterium]
MTTQLHNYYTNISPGDRSLNQGRSLFSYQANQRKAITIRGNGH